MWVAFASGIYRQNLCAFFLARIKWVHRKIPKQNAEWMPLNNFPIKKGGRTIESIEG